MGWPSTQAPTSSSDGLGTARTEWTAAPTRAVAGYGLLRNDIRSSHSPTEPSQNRCWTGSGAVCPSPVSPPAR